MYYTRRTNPLKSLVGSRAPGGQLQAAGSDRIKLAKTTAIFSLTVTCQDISPQQEMHVAVKGSPELCVKGVQTTARAIQEVQYSGQRKKLVHKLQERKIRVWKK